MSTTVIKTLILTPVITWCCCGNPINIYTAMCAVEITSQFMPGHYVQAHA